MLRFFLTSTQPSKTSHLSLLSETTSQTEYLEKRLAALEESIKKTTAAVVNNRPQMNINLDKNGLWETYERQKGRTKYINERLNLNR